MTRRRLAIIVSHPIQYYAPVFRELTSLGVLEVCVFYTWSQTHDRRVFDQGFGKEVAWDVPLLNGYTFQFVQNTAENPGTEHFSGLKNPTLIPEIERWGAEAVLVYGWCHQSHLEALRHFKGRIPVFFRGDSTLLDARPWWRNRLRRLFLSWVYRHVDVAICVGSNSRDYFAWCGLPAERIAFAPHSIDTLRFGAESEAHERAAAAWRERLGIPPPAAVCLFAGKLQRKKNPDRLLEACARLGASMHLIVVGNGELESDLRERARGLPQVHFEPFQNQSAMPTVYRLGDVFALPSGWDETWGLALNEAMACGRALLASDRVGGARDLITPGRNGWIFESGNAAALEQALRAAAALGHDGLRSMGAASRAASEAWSTEESARRMGETIDNFCRSGLG